MLGSSKHHSVFETSKGRPQLVVFNTDAEYLKWLQPFSSHLTYIEYEVGSAPEISARARLDAIWVPPMTAMELFGVAPPFPLHRVRVIEIANSGKQKPLPRYAIIGVAISKDDDLSPADSLRLVISELLKGIREFNSKNQTQILRIGILPDDLLLKKLGPELAFEIIEEEYEKFDMADRV